MPLTSTYLVFPALIYILMVSMPKGQPALRAALACAFVLVALWLGLRLGKLPPLTDNPENQTLVAGLFLLSLSLAWFIGSTLQMFRMRMPDHWPKWAWPLVAIGAFCAFGAVILRMI
ncbi:MAG: hypothetical protein AAF066_12250 [Pseudomonadota bacterium]